MNKRVKVNVGTLDEMGQRFVNAWHRLERGKKVRERHLTFPDLRSRPFAGHFGSDLVD